MLARFVTRGKTLAALVVCALVVAPVVAPVPGAAAMPMAAAPASAADTPCPHHGESAAPNHAGMHDHDTGTAQDTPEHRTAGCVGVCCIACFPIVVPEGPGGLGAVGRPAATTLRSQMRQHDVELHDPPPRFPA